MCNILIVFFICLIKWQSHKKRVTYHLESLLAPAFHTSVSYPRYIIQCLVDAWQNIICDTWEDLHVFNGNLVKNISVEACNNKSCFIAKLINS